MITVRSQHEAFTKDVNNSCAVLERSRTVNHVFMCGTLFKHAANFAISNIQKLVSHVLKLY